MFKKYSPAHSLAIAILASGIGFSSLPASGQTKHYGASAVEPGHKNGATGGRNTAIRVRKSDCRLMQKHVPAADVAFQPGVGKTGRQVAPADISPGTDFGKTEDLDFAFTVRLKNALPEEIPATGASDILGEAPIGKVELHNGVVSFNGVALDQDQSRAVSAACAQALENRPQGKIRK